jgi:hypothetical protein
MEREVHVLVESRDSTGISLRGESPFGLGTQEDVNILTEIVFNSDASESFKRTGVEQVIGVYTTASVL